ncbi:hypothetical protein VOM14_10365 [Paraburkholderia sp. MPAMCS5]|uniref:hypothetical protein n=1 Tax=Paraburkholderia sp. MPAMCS5 TaxID=3112563 RepID=UPI002E18529F|nr:hypothetical protein [Paraburkholderia sp. MPAMCS5]
MAISGSAFLALWNDVSAESDTEYNRWHTDQHVPERVGIAGFISGRRYRSSAPGQHRYFTLYETETSAVFDSAAYLDVIERPTAWSASMRPLLKNVVRATCDTVASTGSVPGQAIACVRISAAGQFDGRALTDACMALAGVSSAHLGKVRSSVPDAFEKWSNAEQPSHVLLAEGVDEATLRTHEAALGKLARRFAEAVRPAIVDVYELVFGIKHSQVDASLLRSVPASDSPL